MIEPVTTLDDRALTALAELERRVVAADGGRLKLEWGVLRSSRRTDPVDLLVWEGDRLIAFCGLYAFGPPDIELAGAVDPAHRRRGLGRALVDAALPLSRERGYTRALLVTPRGPGGGAEFAAELGAPLDHSEHAMVQDDPGPDVVDDPAVTLRRAGVDGFAEVRRLVAAAFGWAPDDLHARDDEENERTFLIDHGDTCVGTVRLTLHDGTGGIYGLAIDPPWQGRGIGREVLRRCCRMLRGEGAGVVRLEVDVENPSALHLYTSVGFRAVTTEDYYELALNG